MTYEEYIKQAQEEFNNLPIFWAFSDKQFEEAMNERGLTVNDTDKIYKLTTGGFCLRKDASIIREYYNKPDPLKEFMKKSEFAESAFYYEMKNHEYHINGQGDWDVCNCFGNCEYSDNKNYANYLSEMGYSDDIIKAFKKARHRFFSDCDKNGWY